MAPGGGTFRRSHTFSGVKHLSAVTAVAPLKEDVNVSRGETQGRGGGGGVVGVGSQWGEIEPNGKRQEER